MKIQTLEIIHETEVRALNDCENVIQRGLSTFLEVGEALLKIGPPAYPAVRRATNSNDRETAISGKRLRDKFLEEFAEQRLPQHDLDVIHTDDAKIAGRIELTVLRVHVPQFGAKTLKVTDLVSVRGAGTVIAEEKVTAQPDPGNLTNFAQQTGKSFYFTVTGNATGSPRRSPPMNDMSRSRSPGLALSRSAPPITSPPTPPDGRSPRRSWPRSAAARYPRSPASGGP